EDVRGRFVEATRLARIDQVGRAAGYAVRHLVTSHVEFDQRRDRTAVAVAERHAEAIVAPECVGVVAPEMDTAQCALAVIGDAGAAVDLVVVIPGHRYAIVRIDADSLRAAVGAGTPDVVGVDKGRTQTHLAIAHVG